MREFLIRGILTLNPSPRRGEGIRWLAMPGDLIRPIGTTRATTARTE